MHLSVLQRLLRLEFLQREGEEQRQQQRTDPRQHQRSDPPRVPRGRGRQGRRRQELPPLSASRRH